MKYTLSVLIVISFITQFSQAKEPKQETDIPLSATDLRIVHSEGASCYDQDQIYKRCSRSKPDF